MEKLRIAVIGGGAAGLMAAGRAAELGADVTLYEKNRTTGKKLLITGKGRCNVANACDIPTFINNVMHNPRFMYTALSRFSPEESMAFFEERGLATKVERGNRVFPVSDKAMDVVDTLYDYVTGQGVQIVHREVKSLMIEDGMVKGVRLDDGELFADAVIVTCGGMSYRATGSTGDGCNDATKACYGIFVTVSLEILTRIRECHFVRFVHLVSFSP